jgi:RNA-splicing ligase RtcB
LTIEEVVEFDLSDPNTGISAGGVGYDINCGVRCFKIKIKIARLKTPREVNARIEQVGSW